MKSGRSLIHFTNELEVSAGPETIWPLLIDPAAGPSFYPGVSELHLLDEHRTLQAGTRFRTNLADQDVSASVQEFDPFTRVACGTGPKTSKDSSITPRPSSNLYRYPSSD